MAPRKEPATKKQEHKEGANISVKVGGTTSGVGPYSKTVDMGYCSMPGQIDGTWKLHFPSRHCSGVASVVRDSEWGKSGLCIQLYDIIGNICLYMSVWLCAYTHTFE